MHASKNDFNCSLKAKFTGFATFNISVATFTIAVFIFNQPCDGDFSKALWAAEQDCQLLNHSDFDANFWRL